MAQPRKRNYMAVQELNRNEYNWQSKEDHGFYSDNTIIKSAHDFTTAMSKGYTQSSTYHYLFEVYKRYYWPLLNTYQHKFDDYNFIFNSKNLRDKAKLIMLHVAMRIEFFSFADYHKNLKHSKGKKHSKFTPIKIASILHNADKSVNGDIVKPHVHYAIKLGKQCTPNQLSKWSGIAPQYFESSKGGRYAFDNELAYLTHEKQPQKYHYNHKNVWSNKPIFDYQKYYSEHIDRWTRYRATAARNELSMSKNLFLQKIANGDITDQMTIRNKHYFNLRCALTKNISDLFTLRERRTAYLLNQELDEGKFSISIIYIYGNGGAGKSQMGDTIVKKLQKEHKTWDFYITSSGKNIFDGYKGEPIIYMDETDPKSLTPKAWATLLDPHNIRTLGARYHNKTIAKRVIVMTTTMPPYRFFGYMKGAYNNPEELGQFMRRITRAVRFIHDSSDTKNLDGTVAIQLPVKYDEPQQVQIGKDKQGYPTYRSTRYVLRPGQPTKVDIVPEKVGINDIVRDVDDRNAKRDHSRDRSTMNLLEYRNVHHQRVINYKKKYERLSKNLLKNGMSKEQISYYSDDDSSKGSDNRKNNNKKVNQKDKDNIKKNDWSENDPDLPF